MTNDRIIEIARRYEAYRDNNVPTVRGADLVLFARQVIDETLQASIAALVVANQSASNDRL